MVAKPTFMMLRDIIKALGKLLVVVVLVVILNFQNGRHLHFKMAAIYISKMAAISTYFGLYLSF